MRLLDRRRALMTKAAEKNGLKPADSVALGTSSAYVSNDGLLHINQLNAAYANRIVASFITPIEVHTDDVVQLKLVKKSGTANNSFCDYSLGDVSGLGVSNTIVAFKNATPLNKTFDALTQDSSIGFFRINARGGDVTGTDYSCEVQIYINGTRII